MIGRHDQQLPHRSGKGDGQQRQCEQGLKMQPMAKRGDRDSGRRSKHSRMRRPPVRRRRGRQQILQTADLGPDPLRRDKILFHQRLFADPRNRLSNFLTPRPGLRGQMPVSTDVSLRHDICLFRTRDFMRRTGKCSQPPVRKVRVSPGLAVA